MTWSCSSDKIHRTSGWIGCGRVRGPVKADSRFRFDSWVGPLAKMDNKYLEEV